MLVARSRALSSWTALVAGCGWFLLSHCGASAESDAAGFGPGLPGGSGGSSSGGSHVGGSGSCRLGEYTCNGAVAYRCGISAPGQDCAEVGMECSSGLGCVTCVPGEQSCDGGTQRARRCNDRGSGWEEFDCDPLQGLQCETSGCIGPCAPPQLLKSHVGCDFYPTVTANTVWSEWFRFGVIVANVGSGDAHVIVTRGASPAAQKTVSKDDFAIIELDWVGSLKGPDADPKGVVAPPTSCVLESAGAYRLRSDQPITVVQFNTLQSENPGGVGKGCPDALGLNRCLSLSNDASLLAPATSLAGSYVALGWHTWHLDTQPPVGIGDWLAITATRDQTQVDVTPNRLTRTLRSPTSPDPLPPGDATRFSLQQGDVLELFSDGSSAAYQWAGATIEANNPIQVLSGAPCANIPDTTPACDHLEELVIPRELLGHEYVISTPMTPVVPDGGGVTRHMVRIQGATNGTLLRFDPMSVHNSATLDAGQVLEFVADVDFVVSSTVPFGVTQYMMGHGTGGLAGGGTGDPSQSLGIPANRYLKEYVFATPAGYADMVLSVVAPTGSSVRLNDQTLEATRFLAVGASGYSVARVSLEPAKRYKASGEQPFGAVMFGYGPDTGFMVPLGLDMRPASSQ